MFVAILTIYIIFYHTNEQNVHNARHTRSSLKLLKLNQARRYCYRHLSPGLGAHVWSVNEYQLRLW